jgi:hypothetical protein
MLVTFATTWPEFRAATFTRTRAICGLMVL